MNKYKILKKGDLQILIKYDHADYNMAANYRSILDKKYFEGCRIITSNLPIPSDIVYHIIKVKRLYMGDLKDMEFDDPVDTENYLDIVNYLIKKKLPELHYDNELEFESDDDAKLYFEAIA